MSIAEYDFKKIGIFASVFIIIIGGIIGGATGYYYFKKYQETEKRFREASVKGVPEDVQSLVAKVSKLIKLPEDESPTVATVSDLAKLQNQPFFAKAKIGDKVLLYMQAKKAFLYDPVNNQIVEVGPLVVPTPTLGTAVGTSSAQVAGVSTQAPPTPTASVIPTQTKISIYNGSNTSGLTDQFAKDLTAKITDINVVQKTNASKKDYAKSVIIDMTNKSQGLVDKIAKEMNLTVSAFPADEKQPTNADILIILGADRT